jgi:hypothetical protein
LVATVVAAFASFCGATALAAFVVANAADGAGPKRKRLPQAHFATWPAALSGKLYFFPQPGHAIDGISFPWSLCRFLFQ